MVDNRHFGSLEIIGQESQFVLPGPRDLHDPEHDVILIHHVLALFQTQVIEIVDDLVLQLDPVVLQDLLQAQFPDLEQVLGVEFQDQAQEAVVDAAIGV